MGCSIEDHNIIIFSNYVKSVKLMDFWKPRFSTETSAFQSWLVFFVGFGSSWLRPYFVKGVNHVFLWRFLQMFRCLRHKQHKNCVACGPILHMAHGKLWAKKMAWETPIERWRFHFGCLKARTMVPYWHRLTSEIWDYDKVLNQPLDYWGSFVSELETI